MFQQNDLIEVYQSGWIIGVYQGATDETSCTVLIDTPQVFPLNSNKLSNFRSHTELLKGSEKIISAHNFMNFPQLSQKLEYFLSVDLLGLQSRDIFQFIRGELYLAIHQILCVLNFQENPYCIESFKNIMANTLSLVPRVYGLEGVRFVEGNYREGLTASESLGLCWPEMIELTRIILGFDAKAGEFFKVYGREGNEENFDGVCSYQNALRKFYYEEMKKIRLEKIVSSENSLRFVLSSLEILVDIAKSIDDRENINEILGRFKNYLTEIPREQYKNYDWGAIEKILYALSDGSTAMENIELNVIYSHLTAITNISSVKKKLDINCRIKEKFENHITRDVLDYMRQCNYHIIILQHETLIKNSYFYFTKNVENQYGITDLFQQMLPLAYSLILEETIRLICEFCQLLTDEKRIHFLAEFLSKFESKVYRAIVNYCQKIIELNPQSYRNIVSLLSQYKQSNGFPYTTGMNDIFSIEKFSTLRPIIIKELIASFCEIDSQVIIVSFLEKMGPEDFKRHSELPHLIIGIDCMCPMLKCIEIMVQKIPWNPMQTFTIKVLTDIYAKICKMGKEEFEIFFRIITSIQFHSYAAEFMKIVTSQLHEYRNFENFNKIFFELFKIVNAESLIISKNSTTEVFSFRKSEKVIGIDMILEVYLLYDIPQGDDAVYFETLVKLNTHFDTSLPWIKEAIGRFLSIIFSKELTIKSLKIIAELCKVYETILEVRNDGKYFKGKYFLDVLTEEYARKIKEKFDIAEFRDSSLAILNFFLIRKKINCYTEEEIIQNISQQKRNQHKDLHLWYIIQESFSDNLELIGKLLNASNINEHNALSARTAQVIIAVSLKHQLLIESIKNSICYFYPLFTSLALCDYNSLDPNIDTTKGVLMYLDQLCADDKILNLSHILFTGRIHNRIDSPSLDICEILCEIFTKTPKHNIDPLRLLREAIKNSYWYEFQSNEKAMLLILLKNLDCDEMTLLVYDLTTIADKLSEENSTTENFTLLNLYWILNKLVSINPAVFSSHDQLALDLITHDNTYYTNSQRLKTTLTRKLAFKITSNYYTSIMIILNRYQEFLNSFPKHIQKAQLYATRCKPPPRGIKNFGSTCYLNSIIQLLYSIPELNHKLLTSDFQTPVAQNLGFIFSKLSFSLLSSVRTHRFLRNYLDYDGNPVNVALQTDAEEFFNTLVFKLQDEGITEITTEMTGKVLAITHCNTCNQETKREEDLLVLSLEAEGNKDIYESIQGYTRKEALVNDNQYFCDSCDAKVDAEKFVQFESLPNNLVISFRRFKFDLQLSRMSKVYDPCTIYEEVEIGEGKEQYDLQTVILHIGDEQSGHYISICRRNGFWYRIDDEAVEKIDNIDFQRIVEVSVPENMNRSKATPYILLYRKKGLTLRALELDYEKCPSSMDYFMPNMPNNCASQEIMQKNAHVLLSKLFFSREFTIYLSKLIVSETYFWYAIHVYFRTFVYSDESHNIVFFKIYKKFLEVLKDDNKKKIFIEYCVNNTQDVVNALVGRSDIRKQLACKIIKKSACLENAEKAAEFIEKLCSVFAFSHMQYDFTHIIEIIVEFMQYQANLDQILMQIFDYIVFTKIETIDPKIDLSNFGSFNATTFNSFFDYLLQNKHIIVKFQAYFTGEYLQRMLKNFVNKNQIIGFAKVLGYLSSDTEYLLHFLQNIQMIGSSLRIILSIKFYEELQEEVLYNQIYHEYILDIVDKSTDFLRITDLFKMITSKSKSLESKKILFTCIKNKLKEKIEQIPGGSSQIHEIFSKNYIELSKLCDQIIGGMSFYEQNAILYTKGSVFQGEGCQDSGLIIDTDENVLLIAGNEHPKIILVD